MNKRDLYCRNCQKTTEQIILGFLPLEMVIPNANEEWVNSTYCLSCDSTTVRPISERQFKLAEERFLYALVQFDVIELEEARNILELD